MPKIVNLLGIRKKAILCRSKVMGDVIYSVMREITEEQEKELDDIESIELDGKVIDKSNIYCYGQLDVNNEEDVNYIRKFNIINLDAENPIHSDYNYERGNVRIDGNIAKTHPTWDAFEWFKYNYLLIGKPKRIIIYKCKKCDL